MKTSWMLGLTLVVGCGSISAENGTGDAASTKDAPNTDDSRADHNVSGGTGGGTGGSTGGGTGGSTDGGSGGGGGSLEDANGGSGGRPDVNSTPDAGTVVDASRPNDVISSEGSTGPDTRQDTVTIDVAVNDSRTVDASVPDSGGGTGGTGGGGTGGGGTAGTGGTGGTGGGGTGGTGGSGMDAAIDLGCPAETDQQFCTRLGKNCETVSGTDNCGGSRDVNCGSCGAGKGCVDHVCKTPVCNSLTYTSEIFMPLSVGNIMDFMIAGSSNAQSLLYARSPTACQTPLSIFLADETSPGNGNYFPRDMSAWWSTNAVGWAALSGDGLTIVVNVAQNYGEAHRPALQAVNFGAISTTAYTAINNFLGGSAAVLNGHVISTSGFEFFYSITGLGAGMDGVYRATRSATTSAFSAGTRMTAIAPTYDSIAGISSDGLTLFMNQQYSGSIFTRNSTSAEFTNPNGTALAGWHHKPGPGCTLFATNTSGGCSAQDIFKYTPQ
jgi:hypothetical protein